MRYLTGSQCSFTKVGVKWSNLLVLQISLTAVFCDAIKYNYTTQNNNNNQKHYTILYTYTTDTW